MLKDAYVAFGKRGTLFGTAETQNVISIAQSSKVLSKPLDCFDFHSDLAIESRICQRIGPGQDLQSLGTVYGMAVIYVHLHIASWDW